MSKLIRKVAGVVIKERKLLLVRPRGAAIFLSPGGKPEAGEKPVEALARELREEAGLLLLGATYMGQYAGVSPFEDRPVLIEVYRVQTAGTPRPGREIEELLWAGGDFVEHGIRVGSVFASGVIPELVRSGLVDDRSYTPRFSAEPGPGRPRVFLVDLDGTLVFGNRPLHHAIEQSLQALLARGDEIVFATSRAPRGVRHVLPGWLLDRPMLFCNGALGHVGGKERFRRPLDHRKAEEIASLLARQRLAFQLEYGDGFYLGGDASRFPHQLAYGHHPPPGGLGAQPLDKVLKIVIATGPNPIDALSPLKDVLDDLAVLVHNDGYLELIQGGVNKFSSFLRFAAAVERGYVICVVSVGNDYNDFEMLVNASESLIVGTDLLPLRHVCKCRFVNNDCESIAGALATFPHDSEIG